MLMGPQDTHGKMISPKVLNWWPFGFAMPGIKKYKHTAYTHIGATRFKIEPWQIFKNDIQIKSSLSD